MAAEELLRADQGGSRQFSEPYAAALQETEDSLAPL